MKRRNFLGVLVGLIALPKVLQAEKPTYVRKSGPNCSPGSTVPNRFARDKDVWYLDESYCSLIEWQKRTLA